MLNHGQNIPVTSPWQVLHQATEEPFCCHADVDSCVCVAAVMAQRAERETALHYFDLQSEDSGLSANKLGKLAAACTSYEYGSLDVYTSASVCKR